MESETSATRAEPDEVAKMSGARHGRVLVTWSGSSTPERNQASLVGAGLEPFPISKRDIIHGLPITGDKPFTNSTELFGNACIVKPEESQLDGLFDEDDASQLRLIGFVKGIAQRASKAGAVVLLVYTKPGRNGKMPLVGASGATAPMQIYFVSWGFRAIQESRGTRGKDPAKLTIHPADFREDGDASGSKSYLAAAQGTDAAATSGGPVAAAPNSPTPPAADSGSGSWIRRGLDFVGSVKTAVVGLDFNLAKKFDPLVKISTSWTADPNVFINVAKGLDEFHRHVQATLVRTYYLPQLSTELMNVADLLEKYRTGSFLSDPCFTLLVCELYWGYCSDGNRQFSSHVSDVAKTRITDLVHRSIDAYTISENPSEMSIFRSEEFEAIAMYRSSNPIQELSWMCRNIVVQSKILDRNGKHLLTVAWIYACCRRGTPLFNDHEFLRLWSQKMLRSDRIYTVDFGLINAFTEAFGSAAPAHRLFLNLAKNVNELLHVCGIVSYAGSVHVEDALLLRVLEGAPPPPPTTSI